VLDQSHNQRETEPEKRDLGLSAADRKSMQDILQKVKKVEVSPLSARTLPVTEAIGHDVLRIQLQPAQPAMFQAQIIRDPQKDEDQKRAAEILRKAHPAVSH
jgi:hypothetical protein